ncbi:VWA domain-containing protein [bacterium]|nr:VWA domain-containing protein [bacterium]QQR58486.1 MAG: VWA domain-containing protein [Candidatus Melainabacteria bacterium]
MFSLPASSGRKLLVAISGSLLSVQLITGFLSEAKAQEESLAASANLSRSDVTQEKSEEPVKLSFSGQGSGVLFASASLSHKPLGECPLQHTSVQANISGYMADVTVKQLFANPYKEKIEAVYTFPLSETGAVDEMTMKVGSRIIHGTIKKKEEAREIYEQAKARGHVASLLDQERPNIFTQSVANIEPGKEVEITIKYKDLLLFENGKYSFAFPTVVGPRFIPGSPTAKTGNGWAPDTDQVPDASKITPLLAPKDTRAGHDISISVNLDSGVPYSNLKSSLHEVDVFSKDSNHAQVSLKDKSAIPNKDFVLSWNVSQDQISSGYITHRNAKEHDGSGFFTLMLLPPKSVTPDKVAPKEMIFLIDCSGSQNGPPLNKAKEALNHIIDHMNPNDTFQIITFNNQNSLLFDRPEVSSTQMKEKAKAFIEGLQARGGTWMAPAVEKVCSIPPDNNRLRIVTFMTDGYVGNDMQILDLVKKHRGTSRWFPFGTGNSVNRFLIDGIAKEGGGEPEYVLLNAKAGEVGEKFYKRIASPVLTDVAVKFEGLDAKEVFPKAVSDVWAQKPLYIKGRYTKPGAGTVTLTGFSQGAPYSKSMKVIFPESNPANSGIASVWARAKVDRLMSEDWMGVQSGNMNAELKNEIVDTALAYHIMTQFTSFVAVEEKYVTEGGKSKLVPVPVEMPEGVSHEAVFGHEVSRRVASASGVGAQNYKPGRGTRYTFSPNNYAAPNSYRTGASGGGLPPTNWGKTVSPGDNQYGGGGFNRGSTQSMVRGGLLKKKTAEMQIIDEKPIVRDYREGKLEEKSAKDKNVNEYNPFAQFQSDGSALRKVDTRLLAIRPASKMDRVPIKVVLNLATPDVLEQLRKLGLWNISKVQTKGSEIFVTGEIDLNDLAKLAKMDEVKRILPVH